MHDQTFVGLVGAAWNRAESILADPATPGAAKREFALAKTALEDAQMRFTRGLSIKGGVFAPADLER